MIQRQTQQPSLRRHLNQELVRQTLFRSLVAPLVALWAVGLGAFLILLDQPALAAVWTAVVLFLGAWMVTNSLSSRQDVEQAARAWIVRQVKAEALADLPLRAALQRSVDLMVEVAVRVWDIEKARGRDRDLERVLADAYAMLLLEYEWAKRAGGAADRGVANDVLRDLDALARVLEARLQSPALLREPGWAIQLVREIEEAVARLRARVQGRGPSSPRSALPAAAKADGGGLVVVPNEPSDLQQLRGALHAGFTGIGFKEGLEALRRLSLAYARLQPVLEQNPQDAPLALSRSPALSSELYARALGFLEGAMKLAVDIQPSELARLERAVGDLEAEIKTLRDQGGITPLLKLKEEDLASRKVTLNTAKENQFKVEQRLHWCRMYADALEQTRMQVAAVQADASAANVNAVVETLQKSVQQARDVQEEMKRLGT